MKKVLIFTTLIFAFHARANDACANKALDALEKGTSVAAGAKVQRGAMDPVKGELSSSQIGQVEGARTRIEGAFGRQLTPDEAVLAKGYSDAFRAGDTAAMEKYKAAMNGRLSDDELEVLRSRIADPTYNGPVAGVKTEAQRQAEIQQKKLEDEKKAKDVERAKVTRENPYFYTPSTDTTKKYTAYWERNQHSRGKIETVDALAEAGKIDGFTSTAGGVRGTFQNAVNGLESMAKKLAKDIKNADDALNSEFMTSTTKPKVEATRKALAEKCTALQSALSTMERSEKSHSGKGELIIDPARAATIRALLSGC